MPSEEEDELDVDIVVCCINICYPVVYCIIDVMFQISAFFSDSEKTVNM